MSGVFVSSPPPLNHLHHHQQHHEAPWLLNRKTRNTQSRSFFATHPLILIIFYFFSHYFLFFYISSFPPHCPSNDTTKKPQPIAHPLLFHYVRRLGAERERVRIELTNYWWWMSWMFAQNIPHLWIFHFTHSPHTKGNKEAKKKPSE